MMGLPKWHCGKESACQCRKCSRRQRHGFNCWAGKFPWSMKWQPTSVFLPGKFHGKKSLMGYSPWGCKQSDMTERLELSLSKIKPAIKGKMRDFPGGPVVKTSPSNSGGVGSIPGWGTKIPRAFWLKKKPKNRSSRVTNSIKTLK